MRPSHELAKAFRRMDEQVAQVREFVEEYARRREVVFYAPVMEQVGLNWRVPADRSRIGDVHNANLTPRKAAGALVSSTSG
jgi:ABC-type antimicrobial peptide transport system ATPase subunit